ncbi:MAG: MFS transporter [Gammaproteobacteria bacterium]|nr:MFS transporter [Gammaproteobacteria bacterium]MCP5139088.1 MFS transporter [Chromatiales bacterium]
MNPQKSRTLLPLLFTGVLMGALDLAIVGPALPAIQADFGMTSRQLAVLFNAYVLCQMIGTPMLAKFADRVGPRLAYLVSIGFFAGGSLLLVIAPDPWVLYLGRSLQGFGGGGIFPIAAAVIGNTLPSRERGPALGILGTVFGLAFLVGPIMGGLLLPYGWQWLFLVNLPIAAVLMAGAYRVLPAAAGSARKPLDIGGIATLSVALAALVLFVSSLDTRELLRSLLSGRSALAAGVLVVLVPVFWRIENRAADPIVRPGLLRSRPVATASLIGTCIGAVQSGGAFYPALAIAAIGVTPSTASWMLLPGVLGAIIASAVAGRLINRISTRTIVTVSVLMVVCSLLIFGLAHISVASFILASVLGSTGLGGVQGAPLRMVIIDNSLPNERGTAQGLLSNFTSMGRLVGAALVGSIAASAGSGVVGYQAAFLGMTVVAGIMLALGLTLSARAAGQTDEAKPLPS